MIHDFAMRYEAGDIDSPDKYFHLLREAGAKRCWLEAMMKREDFDKMADNMDDFLQGLKELPDIRADLEEKVKAIKEKQPITRDFVNIIEETEHAAFIKDIVNYLILNSENKANSVIIYGAPNAGKT